MAITTKKKVVEVKFMSYDAENKKLSKAEFIEKRKKQNEIASKVKEFENDLKKDLPKKVKEEKIKK